MKHIKLILLDLDGTTVESRVDALPSAHVIEAVRMAQDAGIHIALATGRPIDVARPVFEALELRGPSVFNGGSMIYDITAQKLLMCRTMTVAQVQEIVRLLVPFGFTLYAEDDQYAQPLTSPQDVQKPIAKVYIEAITNSKVTTLLEELRGIPNIAPHPTSSWKTGDVMDMHVTHKLGTKRHGVERLMSLLRIDKAHTMAIGDSFNDVPLFEAAGLRVAMGNAPVEVKSIADEVTSSLDDDGVALAIERFAL